MTGVVDVESLSPVFVGDWGRGRVAGCFVALALLFAVVTKGDACFFSLKRTTMLLAPCAKTLQHIVLKLY